MERYSEYKDSGVQWLGEIPGHWGCTRLKYITSKIGSGSTPTGGADVYQDNGIIFLRSQNVYNHGLELEDVAYISETIHKDMKGTHVQAGDILYNITGGSIGRCCMAPESLGEANVNQHVSIVRPRNIVNKFLLFSLQSNYCQTQMWLLQTGGNREGLSATAFKLFNITLPPLPEQHSIVSYLDDKCGKIDKMLEGKQKQIELLAEMKQRIIADAVTRGLNREVKMKATNIPWLPEIPEHWELRRLKSLFDQRTESYSQNEQLEVLSLLKDVGVVPYSEKGNVGNKAKEDFSSYRVARKGDIVMNSMNVIIGSVDITKYDGYISPAYYALTAKSGVSTEYYNYIFHMKGCQKHMRSLANGILEIRLRISTSSLFGMYYPVPPRNEQLAIVSYINDKVSKIDTLTSKLQQEIESIKEYKQRLISDVVTGQIKVC